MILTTKNTVGKQVQIHDINGTIIPAVYYFNTKTGVIKMYLTGENVHLKKQKVLVADVPTKKGGFKRKIAKIRVTLPGAYAVVNGKIVK